MGRRRKKVQNIRWSKVFLWATALLLSMGVLGLVSMDGSAAIDAKSWSPVDGRVVSSDVTLGCGKGGKSYLPKVLYTYSFQGVAYTGTRIALDAKFCGAQAEATAISGRFPAGQAARVFVNRNQPSSSALLVGVLQANTIWLTVGVMAMFVLSCFKLRVWLNRAA